MYFFATSWHIRVSDSSRKIFLDPLSQWIDFRVEEIDENFDKRTPVDFPDGPLVFWQTPPPQSWLASAPDRIIWVPMADDLPDEESGFWERLPKSLRVVALSDVVQARAKRHQLPCFFSRFHLNPEDYVQADWSAGRVAYYWNRRDLVTITFLRRFCRELRIDRLLFRPDLDPGVDPSYAFQLPSRIGSTIVDKVEWMESPDAYAERTASANIVIAPRGGEGVGIVLLEALARGACTIAYDAPTMDEYIENGRNGLLLRRFSKPSIASLALRAGVWASGALRLARNTASLRYHHISGLQDWRMLSNLDLQRLGEQARQDHFAGALAWNFSLPSLVSFLSS